MIKITDDIKLAIKVLHPDAKALAMDDDGMAYVFNGTLRKMDGQWRNGKIYKLPALDNYSDDWENSLIEL